MSSGEEFEIQEILEQRKRKGLVEYLVRWRGFNDLYDSWEPASGLTDCSSALKAFAAKLTTKRSRSKSRSKSRSRSRASKSRSRSRSRGRKTKSDATPKRSRSRSGGRSTKSSSSISSKLISDVKVTTKEESSSVELRKPLKLRSEAPAAEKKAASSSSEKVVEEKSSSSKEGEALVRKTEVVKTTVETVKSTPNTRMEASGMTTRSRLAVKQVANDQKLPKATQRATEEKGMWWWWFADHAVLVLFIVVSLIALSFTIESISGVRDKLIPDLGVLRQRLGESYDHFVQGVSSVCNNVYDTTMLGFSRIKGAIFFAEETPASTQSKVPPPSPSPKA